VAITIVRLLLSICMISGPVVLDEFMYLTKSRSITCVFDFYHLYPSYPHKIIFHSCSLVESFTLYTAYVSAISYASSFSIISRENR
jgi:hypothetical protein